MRRWRLLPFRTAPSNLDSTPKRRHPGAAATAGWGRNAACPPEKRMMATRCQTRKESASTDDDCGEILGRAGKMKRGTTSIPVYYTLIIFLLFWSFSWRQSLKKQKQKQTMCIFRLCSSLLQCLFLWFCFCFFFLFFFFFFFCPSLHESLPQCEWTNLNLGVTCIATDTRNENCHIDIFFLRISCFKALFLYTCFVANINPSVHHLNQIHK